MGSEQQYIDLFKISGDLVRANSAEVMNDCRDKAFADFCRLGFPSKKSERYRYTDIQAAFAPNYGVNLNRCVFPVNPYEAYHCGVNNLAVSSFYYMVNDMFYTTPKSGKVLPEGVYVGSLRDYARQRPDFVRTYYGRIAPTGDDALTALNTAFAQDGVLVYVPDGVSVELPIQVVNLLCGKMDLMTNRRVLVVLGKGAKASLLFCDHAVDDSNFLTTQVGEIYVGAGASLCLYAVENTTDNNRFMNNVYIAQDADSQVEYATVTVTGGLTRRECNLTFRGKGGSARLMGAVVADHTQHVDNNLLIDHQKEGCKSDVLFKYVLDDTSVCAFAGKVLVRPGAQKTDSQETNANLCVSPTARCYTQPMLEIYADDVKCNHGSTVGQLDKDALFYMTQRGISPQEARLLMQHAFINEVLEHIRLVPLRETLAAQLMQRFRGGREAACHKCEQCNRGRLNFHQTHDRLQ